MIVVAIVLGAAAAVLALPALSDAVSLLAGRRPPRPPKSGDVPQLLFLVPAHDEELLLADTLRSFDGLRYPADRFRVMVIADNCTDDTAGVARACGVHCLERHDLERRGKPHAIAWALTQMALEEHDAVVIVDADSTVDPDFALALAAIGPLRHRAAQTFIDIGNRDESALTVLGATFSLMRFRVINAIKRRAGLNVPFGTGLVLGTDVLRAHGWQAFSICEDWEQYALLTAAGVEIANVPDAHTYVQEARSLEQSASQRRRWAAGKIEVLLKRGGAILRSHRIGARQKLDAIAELSEPGPVVVVGIALLLAALALLLPVPGRTLLLVALLIPVARLLAYTALAVRLEREPWRAARALGFLPFYLVWRLAVQLSSLRLVGSARWVRTTRHRSEAQGASDAASASHVEV
jgi:cellulose synthase/poly-beta-1,6-N-acetylglucosamine synthase-like glycosyltransferase